MSKFEWTIDGKILYAGNDSHSSKIEHGELIAHFDDDNELIIDCAWFEIHDVAANAVSALREEGLTPEQFREFTWENFACLAAGLKPWETTLETSKACEQCGENFDRDDIPGDVWTKERNFQNFKLCTACAAKIDDPLADTWEL